MNVLLTHELFPPDFAGGGEYVVHRMAQGLLREGIGVHVLTTGDPKIDNVDGIPTTRLSIHRYNLNLAVRHIVKLARGVDLIQTFNYHGCLPSFIAGKYLHKPVLCLCLGLFSEAWLQMRGPVLGRIWRNWEKFLMTRAYTRMIFLSEHSRRSAISLGVNEGRAMVNSPGVDLERYTCNTKKDDVVLFVGKLNIRKGTDHLLEVARALPQVRFRIVGWGPEERALKQGAPANVEFAKFVRGQQLRDEFARARIFFFPSRAETFGIVLVEAMASGCAVVSTIPYGKGRSAVPVDDRQAMVQAIRRLWEDREECERQGRRNLELAETYSWDRFTNRLVETYEEILKGKGMESAKPVGSGSRNSVPILNRG